MEYFEYPREADAATVAEALDIATPTFAEHLAAAQRKLLEGLLDEPEPDAASTTDVRN